MNVFKLHLKYSHVICARTVSFKWKFLNEREKKTCKQIEGTKENENKKKKKNKDEHDKNEIIYSATTKW